MTKLFGILLAVGLFATLPASAGTLTLDEGKAVWQSNQCSKPTPPDSVMKAHSETSGENMNRLITLHNAYVDAAQNYMNCIKAEAMNDQTQINLAIASNAKAAITSMQNDVMAAAPPSPNHQ